MAKPTNKTTESNTAMHLVLNVLTLLEKAMLQEALFDEAQDINHAKDHLYCVLAKIAETEIWVESQPLE